VRAGERERVARLVRVLRRELDLRQAATGACEAEPCLVVLVDGFSALRADLEDPRHELLDDFDRVLTEGPRHGIVMAATADRAGSVPLALATVTSQKWVFQPADRGELASFGLRPADVPGWCPGRFVSVADRLEAQIGWPGEIADEVAALADRWPVPSRRPPTIGTLPATVALADLPVPTARSLPLGIGDGDLAPVALAVHPGDHVLVAGPSRSGRSTALAALAQQVRRAEPQAWLGAVTPRRSALRGASQFDAVAGTLADLGQIPLQGWLLIDDAELVDDSGSLAARIAGLDSGLHLAVACRADTLRSGFGHWTQQVRRSRLGVLLQPDVLVDGDLLGVTLPRHGPVVRAAGRGYLVSEGRVELVQLAVPAADQAGAAPRLAPASTALRAAWSSARAPAVVVGPAARIIAAPTSDMSAARV
jgi:S-DNA-T family DNA segregation ATPase FtsK/SpoIIIE